NIRDTLALPRLRGEADKVDRMSELERIADLADRLEAADARPLTGARVDDDHRPLALVELDACRGNDADQRVIDRPWQLVAAHHNLEIIDQNGIDRMRPHLLVLIAAPAQDIQEQDRPLREVSPIFN